MAQVLLALYPHPAAAAAAGTQQAVGPPLMVVAAVAGTAAQRVVVIPRMVAAVAPAEHLVLRGKARTVAMAERQTLPDRYPAAAEVAAQRVQTVDAS